MHINIMMVIPPNFTKDDEGMKKISSELYRNAIESEKISVKTINIRNLLNPVTWRSLRSFKAEIVHYMMGPSTLSFIITKFLVILTGADYSIISAPNPQYFFFKSFISKYFPPSLILTQSKSTDIYFQSFGLKTSIIFNGVDLKKFKPASKRLKDSLRRKYNLEKGKNLVLHVGHVKQGRNLEVFKRVQEAGHQVIIIGSTSTRYDNMLVRELIKCGCYVWIKYFPHIEEVYQLSDCYVFSVLEKNNAIVIPLSVLEAAACNLPVVTTSYGGLKDMISMDEKSSFFYYKNEKELFSILNKIYSSTEEIKTRDLVAKFSWNNIFNQISKIYHDLVFYGEFM